MSDLSTNSNFNKLSKTAIEQRAKDKEHQKKALDVLQAKFGSQILDVTTFRDDTTVTVKPEDFRNIILELKENPDLAYDHLSSVTGIDYLRMQYPGEWGEIRFGVVYNLFSYPNSANFAIRVVVDEEDDVPSVFDLWHGADWQEREVYDLIGVKFAGHPDLRRLFLYDDFEGEHPLRKDYPLRGKGERDRSWRHVQRAATAGEE
jgi:NADH-quinone oxidoreductase subunit C